ADARILDPAKRRAQVAEHPAIDPDDAAVQRVARAMRPRQITGPQRRGEAVTGRVRQLDRFRFRIERKQCRDRPEDLFLIGATGGSEPFDQRRLDEETIRAAAFDTRANAAAEDAAALVARHLQATHHLVEVLPRDERALVGARLQRIADAQSADALDQLVADAGVNTSFD